MHRFIRLIAFLCYRAPVERAVFLESLASDLFYCSKLGLSKSSILVGAVYQALSYFGRNFRPRTFILASFLALDLIVSWKINNSTFSIGFWGDCLWLASYNLLFIYFYAMGDNRVGRILFLSSPLLAISLVQQEQELIIKCFDCESSRHDSGIIFTSGPWSEATFALYILLLCTILLIVHLYVSTTLVLSGNRAQALVMFTLTLLQTYFTFANLLQIQYWRGVGLGGLLANSIFTAHVDLIKAYFYSFTILTLSFAIARLKTNRLASGIG